MTDTCSITINYDIINIVKQIIAICLCRQFGSELRQRTSLRSTRSQRYQYHQHHQHNNEDILMNFLLEIVLMFVINLAFGKRKKLI